MSIMIHNLETRPENIVPVTPWKDSKNLQKCVRPISYDLMIRPSQDLQNFNGRETITVEVTAPVTCFLLHALNLNITSSKVTALGEENRLLTVQKSFYYEPHQFWVIKMENEVNCGTYYLDLEFSTLLQTNYKAFYKKQYYDEKENTKRTIIGTQCRPMSARQIYPCFDEPEMKAKYKFKIVRPAVDTQIVTIGMVEKEEFGSENNEIIVFFKETQPVPTFMTGFLLADVKQIACVDVGSRFPTNIKLHCRSDIEGEPSFTMEVAEAMAKYFIDFFQISFPFEKIDLVALPDLPVPVLEHFSYALFKEKIGLFKMTEGSTEEMNEAAIAVAGTFCRQWFESLVTMKNWEDFWVTEGFCSFMQYKALREAVNYGFGSNVLSITSDELCVNAIQTAMYKDTLSDSHPLQNVTENPHQKSEVFDQLTRYKGLALFRMVENFMGEEEFRNGIHNFLNAHLNSSATAQDLWEYLNREINIPDICLKELLGPWTKRSGFPALYVIRRASTWMVSQSKAFADPAGFNSVYGFKWDIPVYYITSDGTKPSLAWFKKSEECMKVIIDDRSVNYVKFNHKNVGYYRVNYEGFLWRHFAAQLQQDLTKLDVLDRVSLLDDMFYFAQRGEAESSLLLDLLKYLEKEKEYLPWLTVYRNMPCFMRRLLYTPCYFSMMKFLGSLVEGLYGDEEGQYNWNMKSYKDVLTRMLGKVIVELACMSKLNGCITDLKIKFEEWIKTGKLAVNKEYVRPFFIYGMRETGTTENWEVVLGRYKKETNAEFKVDLLICLANVRDYWILTSLLENSQNEIMEKDYVLFLKYLSENPHGCHMLWGFLRTSWDYLALRYSDYVSDLQSLLMEFLSKFNTKTELEEVEHFIKKFPEVWSESDQKLLTSRISDNIKFSASCREPVLSWLTENLAPSV